MFRRVLLSWRFLRSLTPIVVALGVMLFALERVGIGPSGSALIGAVIGASLSSIATLIATSAFQGAELVEQGIIQPGAIVTATGPTGPVTGTVESVNPPFVLIRLENGDTLPMSVAQLTAAPPLIHAPK